MKRTILFCLLLCVGAIAFAQEHKSPIRFGVKTGLNLSTAFVSDAWESKFKPGYNVGITAEWQLKERFLIQSGLSFTAKGSKQENFNASDYVGGDPDFTHTFNQFYLELPLYAAYKVGVSNQMDLILGAGPYFAYGLGGKTKQKLNSGFWSDGTSKREWNTFGHSDSSHGESLKRFDFGAGIKADLEYKNRYVLGIGFSSSIINIARKGGYRDLKYRNFNMAISLGYKF
ncbi:porin family protein [Dysgonomonas sp. 25]|uniref:porin family protein n=1 Tax=Dysgonomonas sp. 25 TaxID=2302933 RepID=UPI0013D78169|nr:porin family protein [Dysgonomonas sp. 25]NDV70366.1 PorT family protein [Dysgonomonas sp. 25]